MTPAPQSQASKSSSSPVMAGDPAHKQGIANHWFDGRELSIIIVPYLVFSILWIWGSDTLVGWFTTDPHLIMRISILKGWGFVLATAVLIYVLLHYERQSRRLAESKLQHQEYLYRLLAENATDIICLFNIRQLRFDYISPSIRYIVGYSREEQEQRSLEAMMDQASFEALHQFLEEIQDDQKRAHMGLVHVMEFRLTCRWGGTVAVEARISILLDKDGKPERIVAVAHDITQRLRFEEELKRQKHRLERAERIGQLGGWTLTLSNRMLWASPEACRIYGLSVGEVNMARIMDIPLPAYRPLLDSRLADLISKGVPYDVEFQIRRPTDSKVLNIHSVAEYDAEQGVVYGIIRDVTEQRQMELQLLRAQRLDSIGSLAGGLAHDLNNLLAPIRLSSPLIREALTKKEDLAMLDIVESSTQKASELIKQVLSFAKGAQGEHCLLRLDEVINEMVTLSRETFPANIRVQMRLSHDLHPIDGNRTQLQQVIMNLLVNARDALTEGGQITIIGENLPPQSIKLMPGEVLSKAPLVHISVADTGCGMTDEVLARLFEPFFSTKGQNKGTGLGLSTVLGIMRGHQAIIRVKSAPRQGTCMDLYFPAQLPA